MRRARDERALRFAQEALRAPPDSRAGEALVLAMTAVVLIVAAGWVVAVLAP